jgi:3',5'-cyclic-AMP phosphodiesterase
MIVVAHISDLHLDGGVRNAERAARVLAYLGQPPRPVDAVPVTGDIADHGQPGKQLPRCWRRRRFRC